MRRSVVRAGLSALALLTALVVAAPGTVAGPKLTARPLTRIGIEHAAKAPSARLAQTDRKLLRMTGSELVPVVVKLDYDAVASYAGGVSGLEATSPAVTGRSLRDNGAAVDAYARYVAGRETEIVSAIQARIPSATVRYSYRYTYGGVAMSVPAGQIRGLLRVDGVAAVQEDRLEQVQGAPANFRFIGAARAWDQIGGVNRAGEGVLIGVLDTGIWPEHPMLVDKGIASPPGGPFACEFGEGTNPLLGDPFTCNDKLAGAYALVDTYMTFVGALDGEFCDNVSGECSVRDSEGHGTHTATTAAGDFVKNAPIFGIERGPASGMAPGASIIAYRVCLVDGCFNTDSMAAVEQAILDGVDVINFSISGGADPYSDPVELAFLDAYAAGIIVNASAGNAGPGPATAEHGGPWVTTVGASTWNGGWFTTLVLESGNDTLEVPAASISTPITTPTEVVDAAEVLGYEDGFCSTELPADSVTGKIVFCRRGVVGRLQKSFNVLAGGGAGMIMSDLFVQDYNTDNHWVPTVHTDGRKAFVAIRDFLQSHGTVRASWEGSDLLGRRGDVMTSFSARGPVGDFLKPDVTAPGIQILAGNTADGADVLSGPDGELYQAIAGTSMSSPHAAGVSALVLAAHPDWTPGQVHSALMTSSSQNVLDYDGKSPVTPFDMGAGSVRAHRAIEPTITISETAENFTLNGPDPAAMLDLNIPSIDVPEMPGIVEVTRTVTNVSGARQTFDVSTEADGGSIAVQPSTFRLAGGASRTLTITIHGERLRPAQYFGRIWLVPRSGDTTATLPVAFVRTQGGVSLTHTCDPSRLAVGDSALCTVEVTNFLPSEANVSLEVRGPAATKLRIQNVSAPGVPNGNGFDLAETLTPAIPPEIVSITPGGSPSGYFPLADLGVPPETGLGDEDIVNFSTDPFLFGGEEYDAVGFTTDGYAVIGGGDSADVSFTPQAIPDVEPPNNVVAPFWTDTNFEFGGDMYGAILSDDVDSWIVLEYAGVGMWDVPDTVSFQIWIRTGDTESVTFAYGPTSGSGSTSVGLTVGAENRSGTSAATLASVPTTGQDYTVVTAPPTAGGSVTITYDAVARKVGDYDLIAEMVSDVTVGITTKIESVVVR